MSLTIVMILFLPQEKSSNPRVFQCILSCLKHGKHSHMLHYVPNSGNNLFEIIYMDKKGRMWTPRWDSLFEVRILILLCLYAFYDWIIFEIA